MKKIITLLCTFVLCIGLVGCGSKTPFEIKEISATKLQKKLDNKDSFVLIIERENCPYCESLQEYIDKTKDEHPNLVYIRLIQQTMALVKSVRILSSYKVLQKMERFFWIWLHIFYIHQHFM